MSKTNNIGTYTLSATGGPASNGVYLIEQADGVSIIAIQLLSGAGSYIGAAKIGSFGTSTALNFVVGETTIIAAEDDFIDGLTITITSGTAKVITNQ